MNKGPFLRLLEQRDLPELVALCREHSAFERSQWTEFDRLPGLKSLFLGDGEATCWVVENNGLLVGFATVAPELSTWDAARIWTLDCLYLLEAFRGQGLGRALMERAAQKALDKGAANLQWQTPGWNESAARFYAMLGATPKEKLRFTLSTTGCQELAGENGGPR